MNGCELKVSNREGSTMIEAIMVARNKGTKAKPSDQHDQTTKG